MIPETANTIEVHYRQPFYSPFYAWKDLDSKVIYWELSLVPWENGLIGNNKGKKTADVKGYPAQR